MKTKHIIFILLFLFLKLSAGGVNFQPIPKYPNITPNDSIIGEDTLADNKNVKKHKIKHWFNKKRRLNSFPCNLIDPFNLIKATKKFWKNAIKPPKTKNPLVALLFVLLMVILIIPISIIAIFMLIIAIISIIIFILFISAIYALLFAGILFLLGITFTFWITFAVIFIGILAGILSYLALLWFCKN